MLIPRIFHGTYKSVNAESRKVVKRLVKGERLAAGCMANDALESLETDADMMLEHPYPGVGGVTAFYLDPLGDMLGEGRSSERRFESQREQALFEEFLEEPWSLSILLGRGNGQSWLVDSPSRMRQYLEAIERHRTVLDAAGAHFLRGTHNEPRPWWSFPGGPVFALANLGVSREGLDGLMDEGVMPDWRSVALQPESVA